VAKPVDNFQLTKKAEKPGSGKKNGALGNKDQKTGWGKMKTK